MSNPCVVIDVTERRREQEALHLVEQRAVLAAQAAGIGTWEMRLPSQETIWDAQMYLMRGLSPDDPRVNRNGGAIALGHPLGMSGARIVLSAVEELHIIGGRHAMAFMCVGVGQGVALLLERV